MSEEKLSSVKGFGGRLRSEREAREVSLEEISRVTKISIHMLHAMEDDDWDSLPGGIFTRNFIRLYAGHIGLDAEKWVDEYRHFIKVKQKAENGDDSPEETQTEEIKSSELPQGWLWALAVFTIILLIGGYFVISYFRDASANEPQNQNSSSEQAQPEESATLPQQTSGNTDSGEQAIITEEKEWEGLTVELTERERARCWFQWWADGSMQSPNEGENLLQGVARSLKAEDRIRLNIAHMQGVEVAVNGRTIAWRDLDPQPITGANDIVTSYVIIIDKDQLPQ